MFKKIKLIILSLMLLVGFTQIGEAKTAMDPNANTYKQVHAAHILVEKESQAAALKMRAEGDESFKSLAKEYSKCPSGKMGGDLGFFGRGQMVKPFEEAAFNTPAGKISDPVQTDFGWHIIKVYEKK